MIKVINVKGGAEHAELEERERSDEEREHEMEEREQSDGTSDGGAFFTDSENESIMSGGSVVRALSKDPMFLVLTKFLVSKKGNNIADILEEIKDHLAFLRHRMA
jgi:hypothetical protein